MLHKHGTSACCTVQLVVKRSAGAKTQALVTMLSYDRVASVLHVA
jgi:hypothetical protein